MMRIFPVVFLAFMATLVLAHDNDNCDRRCSHRSVFGATATNYFQNTIMNRYDLKYMKLELDVMPQSRNISGSCTYHATTIAALDTFAIEFRQNMVVDSVYVNNIKRTFTRANDHIYIPFSSPVAAGTQLQLQFYYRGTASGAAIYAGSSTSTGLRFAASLSESFQAREWYPAKQLLADKIDSADLWFSTDAQYLVGSNGLLKEVVDLPANRKQYRWATRYPIAYYLPSFAVGNYMQYTNYAKPAHITPDSIPVLHYIVNSPSYFGNVKTNLDKTPPFLEKMSELFGLYPFHLEKYGHKQASIGGGMEHQTMSTMDNFGTSLIAHELGHQWFGNNVTCATWNDIWINEGFASYSEYLMMEYLPALYPTTTAAANMLNVHNNVMSATAGSVYVPIADSYNENRIFSGRLTYDKGSAIVHNLRFEMQSDSLFFRTLRLFQQRFKDSVATGEDFRALAEEVTGRSFADFFNQWYYGQGYPTYSVNYGKESTDVLRVTVSQTTSAPAITPFFKGLLQLRIKSLQGDTIITVNNTSNNQVFNIPYSKNPSGIDVDPNNWIINKVGSVVTSIDNITAAQAGVKISPNPTKGELNISLPPTGFKAIRITDLSGRVVGVHTIPSGSLLYKVNLNASPGLYLVQVSGNKGRVVEKILVQ
ncbi:M1 family aminopeptidase [Aridibaculum aurantiacum]|uniref:M1 family aminopeptidase n=1 Tax=Aridibaculum aurantiacum TaxID=2810307 RepID=UPI001A978CE8|nr:M1 family aminopeptidase [Aridibaculum aurantiacum]